ncbi:MAG: excinuclease ABC subunit UvrA [Elusimicrobia bacterium]|nr:excinuclease ABC subunit UvrA [Elusimicrobiota bacterium]
MQNIKISGARQHNLKNISLEIPRGKLVVVTGLSGSGKSSLAFDTIYAEGQRRYVESLSAYARQFLELMEKPDVDHIEGLSPSISIEQHSPSHNPRSTVATVTEIYDYFRLLYARTGKRSCHQCGRPVQKWSRQEILSDLRAKFSGKTVYLLAPLVSGKTGSYEELFSRLKKSGYAKVRVDGQLHELGSVPALARYKKHDIELLVDELAVSADEAERLTDSLENALGQSKGLLLAQEKTPGKAKTPAAAFLYSEHNACPHCAIGFQETEPRLFSFNSPHGACPECDGLGIKTEIAEELVVPDPSLSIRNGAVAAWSNPITTRTSRWKGSWGSYYMDILRQVCRASSIPENAPWKTLTRAQKDIILYGKGATYRSPWGGDKEFEGVIGNLQRRHSESESEFVREEVYHRYMRERQCPACRGARLKPEALAVTVGGKNIAELSAMAVSECLGFFQNLQLDSRNGKIAVQILKEIKARLGFLASVGLTYLTLDRRSETLSGGESQRIHLATQIGSGLTGVLYVLDEPTIGLHPRDNTRLLQTLKTLRDLDNTLIIVEHDAETIRTADWVVDLGPGAGEHGGRIVAQGTPADIMSDPNSLTGLYLSGGKKDTQASRARKPGGKYLCINGASQFNLKNIDVKIPLGLFVSVTGVSGSGKSTLVHEILYKAMAKHFYGAKELPGAHKSIKGLEHISKAIIVDQSPIGRTPRSNPATYTGLFGPIRELFSRLPEARRRGYQAGRFSFNVKGGRCEKCQGDGTIRIQMQFLPDIHIVCEECAGQRFNPDTLAVKYKGKSIAEVLDMSVSQALEFFGPVPGVTNTLKTLEEVGLGYIKLGQSATTLSGGEAQRVKLASELCRRSSGGALYVLDEPTTGLHFADVEKLLQVLHKLVDNGNTVLVIEHNLEVIKTSDWILDLGPEGGNAGGEIVAQGSPDKIMACAASHTGRYLKAEQDAG